MQLLPNGNTFVAWGSNRWFSEYGASTAVQSVPPDAPPRKYADVQDTALMLVAEPPGGARGGRVSPAPYTV